MTVTFGQAGKALGCAIGALRILRRHRSLVVIALALGAFNGVEMSVAQHALFGHTEWGKHWVEQLTSEAATRQAVEVHMRWTTRAQLHLQDMPSSPCPRLSMTIQLLRAALHGDVPSTSGHWTDTIYFTIGAHAVGTAPSVFVLAGYLGLVLMALSGGPLGWRTFWGYGRRFWVRLGEAVGLATRHASAGACAAKVHARTSPWARLAQATSLGITGRTPSVLYYSVYTHS